MTADQAHYRYRYAVPLIVAIVIAIAGLIAFSTHALPLDVWLPLLRVWIEDQGSFGILIFGLIFVISVLLFIPGALLTMLAGGIFGLAWGTVIVSVASSVADGIAFLIARYYARGAVTRLAQRYPRFGILETAITEAGWPVVALLRLSPTVPYSASNYLYGLTGIRFFPYWITTWAFTLPGTAAYVYLGYAGSEALVETSRTTVDWYLLYLGLAATLGATFYLAIFARRALLKFEHQNT